MELLKFGFLFLLLVIQLEALTINELKEGSKLMKTACIGISKVKPELLDGLHTPNRPDTKEVRCYVKCILEMYGSIKRGKADIDSTIKQIDLVYPEELKENAKKAVIACKDVMKASKNHCDGAYNTLMCLFDIDPDFFFP